MRLSWARTCDLAEVPFPPTRPSYQYCLCPHHSNSGKLWFVTIGKTLVAIQKWLCNYECIVMVKRTSILWMNEMIVYTIWRNQENSRRRTRILSNGVKRQFPDSSVNKNTQDALCETSKTQTFCFFKFTWIRPVKMTEMWMLPWMLIWVKELKVISHKSADQNRTEIAFWQLHSLVPFFFLESNFRRQQVTFTNTVWITTMEKHVFFIRVDSLCPAHIAVCVCAHIHRLFDSTHLIIDSDRSPLPCSLSVQPCVPITMLLCSVFIAVHCVRVFGCVCLL